MKISKINNTLLWIVIFFTFLGFYSVLLLSINFGMTGFTRQLSIPIRILIGLSSLGLFTLNIKNNSRGYLKWAFIFFLLYLIRIFTDIIQIKFFYISYSELIFYFISFCIIPFMGIGKLDFTNINLKKTYYVFLTSSLLFALMSIILYGNYLGEVTRLTTSRVGEDVISPLILSYCSALIIGVLLTYLIFNKTSKLVKLFSIAAIVMSVVPFYLGASRGGIIAIFIPFILIALSNLTIKNIIRYSFYFLILIMGLIYLDNYFQSGLLDRFLYTTEAIETNDSSASRVIIWQHSLSQFLDNPFFGDKLNTDYNNNYPHNIILEVLQTTGVMGLIPFIFLLSNALLISIKIFKYSQEHAWIAVFFLHAFIQNMFSGALYSAAWFWTSLAMVLSFNHSLKKTHIKQ